MFFQQKTDFESFLTKGGGVFMSDLLLRSHPAKQPKKREVIIVTDNNSRGHSGKDKPHRKLCPQCAHHYQYSQLPGETPKPEIEREQPGQITVSWSVEKELEIQEYKLHQGQKTHLSEAAT